MTSEEIIQRLEEAKGLVEKAWKMLGDIPLRNCSEKVIKLREELINSSIETDRIICQEKDYLKYGGRE